MFFGKLGLLNKNRLCVCVCAAKKPMDFESKPVITDATKCSDIGVDMDGDGFKSHKAGAPGKENSQVYLYCIIVYLLYISIVLLLLLLKYFATLVYVSWLMK